MGIVYSPKTVKAFVKMINFSLVYAFVVKCLLLKYLLVLVVLLNAWCIYVRTKYTFQF